MFQQLIIGIIASGAIDEYYIYQLVPRSLVADRLSPAHSLTPTLHRTAKHTGMKKVGQTVRVRAKHAMQVRRRKGARQLQWQCSPDGPKGSIPRGAASSRK